MVKVAALLAFLAIGDASAFAPQVPKAFSKLAPVSLSKKVSSSSSLQIRGGGSTQRKSAESTDEESSDDDAPLGEILVVDVEEVSKEIAKNWGFILQDGVIKMTAGTLAVCAPIFANEVAYVTLAMTLFVSACFNMAGLFFAEQGSRLRSFALGIWQGFLAYRMQFNPFESLKTLTILYGASSILEGIYSFVLSIQNSDMPGYGWHMFSGLASIVGGAWVAVNWKVSGAFVLGALMAANLLSSGAASIAIAMEGRDIANEKIE